MNKILSDFARDWLKQHLALVTDQQRHIFKLMYCPRSGRHDEIPNLELPINDVVDFMDDKKLDWAMSQVEGTLHDNQST